MRGDREAVEGFHVPGCPSRGHPPPAPDEVRAAVLPAKNEGAPVNENTPTGGAGPPFLSWRVKKRNFINFLDSLMGLYIISIVDPR